MDSLVFFRYLDRIICVNWPQYVLYNKPSKIFTLHVWWPDLSRGFGGLGLSVFRGPDYTETKPPKVEGLGLKVRA